MGRPLSRTRLSFFSRSMQQAFFTEEHYWAHCTPRYDDLTWFPPPFLLKEFSHPYLDAMIQYSNKFHLNSIDTDDPELAILNFKWTVFSEALHHTAKEVLQTKDNKKHIFLGSHNQL